MHFYRLPLVARIRHSPVRVRYVGASSGSSAAIRRSRSPPRNRWFFEGGDKRHASSFSLISLPLNGAELMLKAFALTLFGAFTTIPNSFGPPATQLALAAICIGTMVLSLIDGLHHRQLEPAKIRSEDAKRR